MNKKLVEEFLQENFPGGPLNALGQGGAANVPGQPGGIYSNMLVGEMFGSAAWATQVPNSMEHQKMPQLMFDQAVAGMGRMRLMSQEQVESYLVQIANALTEHNRANEALALYKMSKNITQTPVKEVIKLAETLSKDKKLTESKIVEALMEVAACLSTVTGQ